MIELPKYSVPTYDPNALEENRRTDFTRRIPTGFTQKQLDRDAKIMLQIARAWDNSDGTEEAARKVVDIFLHKAKLLTNPRYWEVMRTVWIAAGSTETANIFRIMMKSGRPCKSWFMTPEDAQALDAMQFPLTVWRAYDPKYDTAAWQAQGGDLGISWTIDKEWCIGYAKSKGRVMRERQVLRNEVFAYVTRRGESEIIIL